MTPIEPIGASFLISPDPLGDFLCGSGADTILPGRNTSSFSITIVVVFHEACTLDTDCTEDYGDRYSRRVY
jgi:hypothetical protein